MIRMIFSAIAIASVAPATLADGPADHRKALEARKSGAILPLTEILEKVRPSISGEIIKVEIEREHGLWVYEFKVLSENGKRTDIYVDGKTGEIIRIKRK